MASGIYTNKEILYVWCRVNRENISNHAFCIIIVNDLTDRQYFDDIASNRTEMFHEAKFWTHESFGSFLFRDLKDESFS